ncbi:hypothetical protein AX774_g2333 [Zancudomyces culisetae]|uniref:Uncharacterized protein n=1 Tax=Zancudomyces culisetae TaxID=1213189 RepID=A0A1R1PTB9_ZANCU|nr:hypothetical protein AX774_g2333 [Zancudomyces culisetae]|eukprot:OMH84143.1 hypothetical protein AX774_g2333 [Zancudomyces culisetae]
MVEKLELLNQGYQTNGNELPKIEELTDHLENVISLNYSGVMDKIPIEIDRSEITLLENNIVVCVIHIDSVTGVFCCNVASFFCAWSLFFL